jgi:uncharacterized protein (TIGR03437 family)
MRSAVAAVALGFLVCGTGQSQHVLFICDLVNGCYGINTSLMGGLRFEDYRVTNPAAVQFDPAQRQQELAAMGSSNAATLCKAPPAFTGPAPTITFDKSTVEAQVYWITPAASFSPSEYMDVQFSNLTTSNGYTSQRFGFRMTRQVAPDGSEIPQYRFEVAERAGLDIVGLPAGASTVFTVDPVNKTASISGAVPASDLLRGAILGVLVNAQSVLNAASFHVTNPAPPGKTLWPGAEIISLAGQAQPWIAAGAGTTVPVGPPYKCTVTYDGYTVCDGDAQMTSFISTILDWGGEYLGLHTRQSYNVLIGNLLSWAQANAPGIDPAYAASGHSLWLPPITKPILMLWPTLRADAALSNADAETIENWIQSLVRPRPQGGWFSDDLGYFAESVNMADAIAHSDDAGFAQGIAQFYGALQQMRADGSFPLAAQLSACSAVYSTADLVHLVSIAEMAATQGYDLYSMKFDGKSLDTAIKFMLDAFENPTLLYQYSKAGGGACFEGKPGDPPDFSGYSHPDSGMAWTEPYLARFPFSATAARLRKIVGSNVNAPPFPLIAGYTGLNATCAFRKSYEFQPVNGAKVAIVSGDGQTVAANQAAPLPLVVHVTDNSGKALSGAQVSFAVVDGSANVAAPAQVLTDAAGMARASVTMGPASGPIAVTATALGVPATFSLVIPGPVIYTGGIVGFGASMPAVTTISPGALFTVFAAQNLVPAGAGRAANPDELVNGILPNNLLGVCVTVGGQRSPILDVYPEKVDAVAPAVTPGSRVTVSVTIGCGTAGAVESMPQIVTVAAASPEFLYFARNPNGQNPVQAVNDMTGANVGPAGLGPGFTPAQPGDMVTIYATGLGPTDPPLTPGAAAGGPAQVTGAVTVTLGGLTLDAGDIIYAGAAQGQLFSQIDIRIPAGIAAGNQPIQVQIGGVSSPPGAFLAIAAP